MAFDKKYFGAPGESELWKVGDKSYLVFQIPETTIVLGFHVVDEKQVQDLVGVGQPIKYDRQLTEERAKRAGFIHAGVREQLTSEAEHPWRKWSELFRTEVQVNPAYRDPKFLAATAAAALQGRAPTASELQVSDWWRNANENQRNWQLLKMSDPAQADRLREENRQKVAAMFREEGAWGTPVALVNRIADYFTNGGFSATEAKRQVKALADPNSRIPLHGSIAKFMRDNNLSMGETTAEHEQRVLDLVRTWLGPNHGWTDRQIKEWAGRFRNSPSAQDSLIDMLGKQRLALYPEHENPALSYEDIAAPWRGFVQSEWGEVPDETDPIFNQIIRLNNSAEARKLLIDEGLKRGNKKVTLDFIDRLGQALGSSVAPNIVRV